MAPPAKRRKRSTRAVVAGSDDEVAADFPSNTLPELPSSPARQPASTASASRVKNSPSRQLDGSPETRHRNARTGPAKSRSPPGVAKDKLNDKRKTADLVALFSKQAERNPALPQSKLEDRIGDPISSDDDVGEHRASTASHTGQNAKKRCRDNTPGAERPPVTSQNKFLRPPRPPREAGVDDEKRPWPERFGPTNLEELAVHKKKVADVRRWLEDAIVPGRTRQRLLILKGAAGTGKTTTVRLLAKAMQCELLEWRNPTGSLGANQGFPSASAQFDEFMGRGGKFGQLETDFDLPVVGSNSSGADRRSARRIILIEEFPNTFIRSSTALTSFRNTLLQYLTANTPRLSALSQQPPDKPITPVIMVISETLLTTTSASADSFTAHRLLGPDITRHPGVCVIEFNAIAPTLLANALELVVQKEARKSGRRRTPGPQVLRRLGEIGDIRSAISSLEFLCLKGDADTDWGSRVAFTRPKRGPRDVPPLTKSEQDTLELISQREASLGIFHAVGKVVYNKRDDLPLAGRTAGEGLSETLPDYMAHHARPGRPQVSVDALMDETGTDTHTFVSALHENYVLSCVDTGPSDPKSSLDYVNDCLENLSDSDVLCPSSDVFFGGRGGRSFANFGADSASQALRQDEITFQIATRGLLFSLPSPVRRLPAAAERSRGDSFKMFYPASIKLWREKEEVEGLVDHWASQLLRGEETRASHVDNFTTPASLPFTTTSGGDRPRAATYRPNASTRTPKTAEPSARGSKGSPPAPPPPPPPLSLGSLARRELLLERLPYIAHLARCRKLAPGSSRLREEVEMIVAFSGIGGPPAEEDVLAEAEGSGHHEHDRDHAVAAWATDRPSEESSPRDRGRNIRAKSGAGSLVSGLAERGMVISDDDIEDD